ncbi:transglycosylase domain-containing protein [Marinivivus vitaminiproducens]|uniref:transglycosylase domain-containing protein n=1 Tax=Marinivivus vitaminiproducens TaxID=3035935 RepID=UPI00279B780E|nr:PBP1A family penicillin-binding protein [Geminicoccaceae bacterium SCSIO 64248]
MRGGRAAGQRPARSIGRLPAAQRARGKAARRPPGSMRRLSAWLITGPIGFLLLVATIYTYFSFDVIDLRDPGQAQRRPSVTLVDDEGVRLAAFGDQRGDWLTVEEMSPWLSKAVVATEDRRFWQHLGLDPIGIARALWRNLESGHVVEGGSTITQQLAKVAFLSPERSLERKIREAMFAVWLEMRFSKSELLEAYLNRIYLGGGAYGADGAAWRYFGKSASDLTLAESAMLAGLIRAPSYYAPTRDLALAQARAGAVLDLMVDTGAITEAQAEAAKADPATLSGGKGAQAKFFADWVYGDTQDMADEDHPDIQVMTTLDRRLQGIAEETVRTVMAERPGRGAGEAALVAMTPQGEVLAMVGGLAYGDSQYNRAVQARRQPGSSFKLFVYLAALEAGIAPEDVISGAPITVGGWAPANFNGTYPDYLSVGQSFAGSINTAAVRLAEQVGRERVIAEARRLGITTPLENAPSVSLGAFGASLLEMTGAYATVVNGGRLTWPTGLVRVQDPDGEILYQPSRPQDQVLDPAVAGTMATMLREAVTTGTGRNAQPEDGRPVAGKTGTSSWNRDAWFIGFSGELVVGVWVGNDDGSPMRNVTGGGLPAHVFSRFMAEALQGTAARPLAPPLPEPKPDPGELWAGELPEVARYGLDEAKDAMQDAVDGVFRNLERWFGG